MPPVNQAPDPSVLRELMRRTGGQLSWRNLEALADTPEFRGYVSQSHPSLSPMLQGPGRRRLLQIMAASLALGGLTSCGRPSTTGYSDIVPYVRQPTGVVPGAPMYYASASLLDGIANGTVVTTYDGRPVKIEGNPEHPWTRGGSDIFMQADVLGLYDPDRSQTVQHVADVSDWDTFHAQMLGRFNALRDTKGQGFRLLTGPVSSPSLLAQIERMQQALPQMHWHVHAPVGRETMYAGAEQALGRKLETQWQFDKADLIVSLDGDFLDPGPQQAGASRSWVEARRKAAKNGKLLAMSAVAPAPTLTYAKADYHLPVAQRDLLPLAQSLLAEITSGGTGKEGPMGLWRGTNAERLKSARGRSIVLTGTHASAELHAVVHQINAALGNIGKTVTFTDPVIAQAESFQDLVKAVQQGQVHTLVMLDTNPVYTAPADADFVKALAQVQLKIHAGLYADETAIVSDWHLPLSHTLESWGDARSQDGTVALIQPTIQPLYDTRSAAEILSVLLDTQPQSGQAMLRDHWRKQMQGQDFDTKWRQMLLLGFVQDSALPAQNVQPGSSSGSSSSSASPSGNKHLEVLLRPDPTIWDGRYANNAWLQELPKPTSKLVWQNVVALSPKLASQHKLNNGDMVTVQVQKQAVTGPVWTMPGQNDETVVLFLGYGRPRAGSVGNDIGYDAYPMRRFDAPWSLGEGTLHRPGRGVTLATSQQIDTEEGHDLIRVQEIGGKPVGDDKAYTQPTLYKRVPDDGRAWGMVIDLDACIGCNACVVACQAENNVPVVGKDQFLLGRDMHWLRVDRYYDGPQENPDTRFMPVPCMHCETAPCELGCPVEATVHDSEGLNLMVYNRCIGTRACNAYCPYKVRHFNYLHYSDAPFSIQAQRNPDVTVRARGVMEKCTYCVQRIVAGRIAADKEHREIRDGEVVTACAGACPTQAIVFGNLEDKQAQVTAARKDPRNYALLGELNTRPRTTYLAAWSPTKEKA